MGAPREGDAQGGTAEWREGGLGWRSWLSGDCNAAGGGRDELGQMAEK